LRQPASPSGKVLHPCLAQVAIHAIGKTLHQVLHLCRQCIDVIGAKFLLGAVEVAEEKIALDVAFGLPHEFGGAAAGHDDLAHGDAKIILRVGIAIAVAEAAPIVGFDMGDTKLGADHAGGVRGGLVRAFRRIRGVGTGEQLAERDCSGHGFKGDLHTVFFLFDCYWREYRQLSGAIAKVAEGYPSR
jgi:hypothetical protein